MCFILESDFFYDKHTVSRAPSRCTSLIVVTLEQGIVFFLKKRTTPNRPWVENLTTNPYVTITHRHNTKQETAIEFWEGRYGWPKLMYGRCG